MEVDSTSTRRGNFGYFLEEEREERDREGLVVGVESDFRGGDREDDDAADEVTFF